MTDGAQNQLDVEITGLGHNVNQLTAVDSQKLSRFRRFIQFPLILLIIGFVLQAIATIAGGAMGHALNAPKDSPLLLIVAFVTAALMVFAHWIVTARIDDSPHSDLAGPGKFTETGAGLLFGFLLFSGITGVVWMLGGYEAGHVIGLHTLWQMLAVFAIIPGVGEEILFRGLLFRYVERMGGSWIALVLSALLFGLVHYANPNAGLFPAIAIAMEAGIMLGAVYMLTRRLWAAIGVHAAWNFTQGWVFGIPVSGFEDPGLISSSRNGPEWLTGGAFGLEASVVAMAIATVAGVVLLYLAHKKGRFVPMQSWRKPWPVN